jgi:hypothetical protein
LDRAQERAQEEEDASPRVSFEDFFGGSGEVEEIFRRAGFVIYEVEGNRTLWVLPSRTEELEEE